MAELDTGKITILSDVRNKKGEIRAKVRAKLETRYTKKNLAKIIFIEKGIEELEEALGILKKDDEIFVIFRK